ncbi:MAG TPA: choice-of-anchor tandem repeat GloVer-containing protein [Steroidobacteraceae bacterium]
MSRIRHLVGAGMLIAALTGCGGGGGGFTSPPSSSSSSSSSSSGAGSSDGSGPSGLIQAQDGNFYGTTATGGRFNLGTVYKIAADGTETLLYSFAGGASDGALPSPLLVQGADGDFYGTTNDGGKGTCPRTNPVTNLMRADTACGTAFKVAPDGSESVLYFFLGGVDGGEPNGGLVQASDGNFYGTAVAGGLNNAYCGSAGCGVVFRLTPTGTESVLYNFGGVAFDGMFASSLTIGRDGNFYGTTYLGGQPNDGTVFSVTPSGAETLLHAFAGSMEGANPRAPLVQASDGNFYGTTDFGGVIPNNPVAACNNGGCGTVFSITPGGLLTTLYAFGGDSTDGAFPGSRLVQAGNGTLYGTTSAGGPTAHCVGGCGTVVSIVPGGAEATLYLFAGGAADGAGPTTGVLQGTDGNLYGTTAQGGQFNAGVVYRVTPGGAETVLHSFGGS